MSANCPSCGGALRKVPQRKTKCPHCGSYLFVRSTPSDPTRRLVTEAAAEAIERAWKARFAQSRVDDAAALFGLAPGMTANRLRVVLMERVMDLRDHGTAMQAAVQLMALAENDARRNAAARWYYAHQLQDLGERGWAAVEIRAGLDACPACLASLYPTFRGLVELLYWVVVLLAVLMFVGGMFGAWAMSGTGSFASFVSGLVFGVFFLVVARVTREMSLMLADLADAAVRIASRVRP